MTVQLDFMSDLGRSRLRHWIDFVSRRPYRPASAENAPEFDLEDVEP